MKATAVENIILPELSEGYEAVFDRHQHSIGIDASCTACIVAAEGALMRMSGAWERFVFELTVDLMAGAHTRHQHRYYCQPRVRHRARGDAETALLQTAARNGQVSVNKHPGRYLILHNPDTMKLIADYWLIDSPISAAVQKHTVDIQRFMTLRHAVAHGTPHARSEARAVMLHFEPLTIFRRVGQFLLHRNQIGDPPYLEILLDNLYLWCVEMSP